MGGCRGGLSSSTETDFPKALVDFQPNPDRVVFSGTGQSNDWDQKIRERGFILFEEGQYKMWYTGYNRSLDSKMKLGYATSSDGIEWKRYSDQPIYDTRWTEDMFVLKENGKYYMFAEGEGDVAHLLTSHDGIQWTSEGDLIIYSTTGEKIVPPYGTPTIWIENGTWYLFYEKIDMGIWLATSSDLIHWNNVQDEPVLSLGPEPYDQAAVAANQVVKHEGYYYMYYHATDNEEWIKPKSSKPVIWTSNIARSKDLIHWEKYKGNPIISGDFSSPILVGNGDQLNLYTMHDQVIRYDHK